ncbi:spore cortex biosynthesis protein YabQ [Heliobacterium mobile]|uniref:spore cortex biosynthesis protein YabQ n=1 Tax=Heliobacterium mobile TaxID=28064 RepID=UPI0012D77103|nr:spore cortex biosynthesis protein YabQ [Heliobacterium mobile]
MTPLAQQIYGFALSAIGGLLLGAGFDLYRTLVRVGRRRWWTSVADYLIWLFGAAIFFLLLLWGNLGEVRVYVFMGLAFGLFLYFRFVSEEVRAFWEGMLELILHVLRMILYLATFPFVFAYRLLRDCMSYLYRNMVKLKRWIHQKVRIPLRRAIQFLRVRLSSLSSRWKKIKGRIGQRFRRPPPGPPPNEN